MRKPRIRIRQNRIYKNRTKTPKSRTGIEMVSDRSSEEWPPSDGGDFIRSDEFARTLVDLAVYLGRRYPHMDFTDAVAHVFAWFDGKLAKDSDFISRERFRTRNAFLAYLRQALWNAGRLAERRRKQRKKIESLPTDEQIVDRRLSPEEIAYLIEKKEALPEPHRTVLWRLFFEEDDPPMIAATLGLTVEEVLRIYEEALDMLSNG
jgi:hypothetical protein